MKKKACILLVISGTLVSKTNRVFASPSCRMEDPNSKAFAQLEYLL